jgi:MraZ protein
MEINGIKWQAVEASGEAQIETGGTAAAVEARANVFGHEAFSGTYRTRLEANGRLVLPSALRSPLVAAASAHVMPRRSERLFLFTPQSFEVMVDSVVTQQGAGVVDPEVRQRFFKAAPKVSVDKQARLVIPPELRTLIGIEGEADVVLAGAIERIEIWPARRFDEIESEKMHDLDLLLDGHGGLPLGTA